MTAADRDGGAHEALSNCRPALNGEAGRRFARPILLARCLVIRRKAEHGGAQFKYLDRTLRPVVLPAHDDVALVWIMAVLAEVA